MRITPWLPVLLAAAGGCTPRAADPGAIARTLDSAYAVFSEGYRTADPALVAGLYGDSALYLAPGDSIVRGRSTIETIFAGFLVPYARADSGGPRIRFEIADRRIAASGDLATDVGYFVIDERARGKFIVVWRRGADGAWRMHADGYSGVDVP
jgi:ketosteroid isomerase-like protein